MHLNCKRLGKIQSPTDVQQLSAIFVLDLKLFRYDIACMNKYELVLHLLFYEDT